MGHGGPDLLAGKGQDGGDHPGHAVQDQVQSGLGGGAALIVPTVETVLDDIQIKVGHLHHTEVVNGAVHGVELIALVPGTDILHQVVERRHGPLVQIHHVLDSHGLIRIETVQVAQHIPGGVADLQVRLTELLHDLLGNAHILGVVGGRHPQAQHIRAVVLDDLVGGHGVAQGLVHGLALAVHGPAVGDDLLVGGHAAAGDGGEHRGLEPAPVLVAALQVYVGGVLEAVPLIGHGGPGGAGIEPHVHDVVFLGEVVLAALGAGKPGGDQLVGGLVKPDVGAVLPEQPRHMGNGLWGDDRLAAIVAVKHRDGHAPHPLAGDAPVIALGNHGYHALLAPGGVPGNPIAGLHRLVLDGVHGAEPLLGGPVDDGVLAPPAVGIGVGDLGLGQQETLIFQVGHHHVVALGVELAVIPRVGHHALGVDGHGHADVGQPRVVVALAHVEVLRAKAGGGVDAAGAGVQGDVVAVENDGILVQQGVLCHHQLEIVAFQRCQHLAVVEIDARLLAHALGQFLGHDIDLAVGGLEEHIVKSGVQGDGRVAGDGPGGGGPDHKEGLGQVTVLAQLALVVLHGELDENGGAGVVLVINLGLGQGGLVVRAPVHGLHALVDESLFRHLAEHLDLTGLELGQERDIGIFPLADDAQALELLGHAADILGGKFPALITELGGGHLVALDVLILEDGSLDGQAVGVPAGDVGGLEARHVLVLDDDVLENFVHGGADVDVAVGIRGAVVEDEPGLARVLVHQLVVGHSGPFGVEHLRLTLGQARPHGEAGFGQVDGLIVIHGYFSFTIVVGSSVRPRRAGVPFS